VASQKKLNMTLAICKDSIAKINKALRFEYSIMDEPFRFVGNKTNKYYVWTAMAYTQTRKPFYYYKLCKHRDTEELFKFDLDLPIVKNVFCDEAFTYDKMYADKAIQAKGAMTNIIEKSKFSN
jgi:IS1 family transposase